MAHATLQVNDGMSDDELRQLAQKHYFNGEYTFQICRKCGAFWTKPNGRWETATILNECKDCYEYEHMSQDEAKGE